MALKSAVIYIIINSLLQRTVFSFISARPYHCSSRTFAAATTTSMDMVRSRGLEQRVESATPEAGGMTLYLKAAQDGTSVGDCPFAQYVRMVLNEKNLDYDVQPTTKDTKPQWLVEHYEGKLPALRHRKECYTESDVIAQYIDFFFQEPPLTGKKEDVATAQKAIDGIFPSIAKYLKHTPDGDDDDNALKDNLRASLEKLNTYLTNSKAEDTRSAGPYLVGDGSNVTTIDCSLAPKLYHMKVGLHSFKGDPIDFEKDYPAVKEYMDTIFSRQSFIDSLDYTDDTIVWGWTNARGG